MSCITLLSVFAGAVYAMDVERGSGDVNGDGWIDVYDARMALRGAIQLDKLTEEQEKAADVDGNGDVTVSDVRFITRSLLGLETAAVQTRTMFELPDIRHTKPVTDIKETKDDGYSGFYVVAAEAKDDKIVYSLRLKNCVGLVAYQLKLNIDGSKFAFVCGRNDWIAISDNDWWHIYDVVRNSFHYVPVILKENENSGNFFGLVSTELEPTEKYLEYQAKKDPQKPLGFKSEDFEICKFTLSELTAGSTMNAHFTLDGVIMTADGLRDSKLDITVNHPQRDNAEPEKPTEPCTHICHSNNKLIKTLWKFVCLLYKLFGAEQYCHCGAKHW